MKTFVSNTTRTHRSSVVVGKVNVDEQAALAGRFAIRSIPTLLFIKDGKVVDTVVGAVPRAEITKRLESLL